MYVVCVLCNRYVNLHVVAGHHGQSSKRFCDMGYCNQPNAYSCDPNTEHCLCNQGYSGVYCENQQCKHQTYANAILKHIFPMNVKESLSLTVIPKECFTYLVVLPFM